MFTDEYVYEDVGKCISLLEEESPTDQDYNVRSEEITVEPSLLDKARNGDSRAFEALIKPLIPKFRWRALKAVGEAYADDVVQEACIKAYTKLHTFREESRFSSWFFAIGTNSIRMHLRSRKRALSKESVVSGDLTVEDLVSDRRVSYELEDQIVSRESLKAAIEALLTLPEGYKNALWSSVIDGLDLASIAEKMGLTPTTAKTRIHRARASLRKILAA